MERFGRALQHLPGGDWAIVELPPESGFKEVGLYGYSGGKLLALKAGSSVGTEAKMRTYLEDLLESTQGRMDFPRNTSPKASALKSLPIP